MKLLKVATLFGGAVLLGAAGCRHRPPQPPQPHPGAVNVQIVATPKDAASGNLAAAVKTQIEADMVQRGLSIGTPAAADVTVSLDIARREAARLDVWRVYEGDADVRVNSSVEQGRLIAAKSFSAKGDRSQAEAAAEMGTATALSSVLNPWLAESVNANSAKLLVVQPPCTCFGCRWIPGYPWFGE